MSMRQSLLPLPTGNNVDGGFDNDGVRAGMDLIKDSYKEKSRKKSEWRQIQDLFEKGFTVSNPSGTKKINSKLLMQALWKFVTKMKPLDFAIHGSGRPDNVEKVVTDAVATVMSEGNFDRCLRDKNGAFWNLALYGDAFMQIGTELETSDDNPYPIKFRTCSLSDVYLDNFSTDIRDATAGNSANEMVLIYRYQWDQFVSYYPEHKNNVVLGEIHRDDDWKRLDKTWQQTIDEDINTIEVAHYFNAGAKRYTVFAGGASTVLLDLKGDKYPYMMNGQGYIPVLHFKCFLSSEGFYNYGLGQLLYDLAIITRRLDNMAVNHAEDNVYPIQMVNVPNGESAEFFNKLTMAHNQRKSGGKGYIVNELNLANPGSRVSMEPFQSMPITQEWERVFMRLEQMITRLGIQLDAVDRGGSITATQILSEEENADATVKQIMEYNASEFKFAVECTMDIMKKSIPEDDTTPLDLTTQLRLDDGTEAEVENITMGKISEELNSNRYFVRVNARSGVIPSNVMQQTKAMRALQLLQPGTPAFMKISKKILDLNDQDVSMQELGMQQQAPTSPGEEAVPPEGMVEGEGVAETEEAKAVMASSPDLENIPVM